MLVLHDPATLEHKTKELLGSKMVDAHESPERITAILEALSTASQHRVSQILFKESSKEWQEQVCQILQTSHNDNYLVHLESVYAEWVKEGLIEQGESVLPECFLVPTAHARGTRPGPPRDPFARAGYYAFDMSTGLSKGSWTSIIASANLAIHAANELITSDPDDNESVAPTVLALCRPPGHHCNTYMAGGYCYINNVVVAIDALRCRIAKIGSAHLDLETAELAAAETRIAILDVDFHHGNGTQDAYYDSDSVLYVSIHGKDEYPYYSGGEDEIGIGAGHCYNVNLPLEAGSNFEAYLEKLDAALGELNHFKPEYLFVSLGFDTFRLDPLGSFDVDTGDYFKIAEAIRSSPAVKQIPCAILLEGGYVIDQLGANMLSFLSGWEATKDLPLQ